MSGVVFSSATELAGLIRTRKLSPVEVTRAFLDRIATQNPRINAFITVTAERALADARTAETEIAAGRYRGPLHGIPYAPKDNLATKGIRTTNGAKITAGWIPQHESTITARLADAGAILLGKLNMLEFAMGSGLSGAFGPARNPWHLDHTPSGSSSGSGASLAAAMTPLAIGTDTGGSIRSPARSCGIVGVKPTYGRVSRYGITPLSWSCDHAGPMARTVTDAAMLLNAIAGPDPRDPSTANTPPVPDFAKAAAQSVKGLRIGVPTAFYFDSVSPDTALAVRAAIATLEKLGAHLVDVTVRNAAMAGPALAVIHLSEAATAFEKRLKAQAADLEPLVRERLETAAATYNATDYIKALRLRTLLMEEMRRVFAECDAMVTPAGNPAGLLAAEIVDSDGVSAPPRPETWSLGNMTGIPALVMPCGFSPGPPLLPIGIQFYAAPFQEETLFRIGQAFETAAGLLTRRPPEA